MARLREFFPAVRAEGPFRFPMKVWREIGEDNLFTLAAALAYSWLFAIFPFLIFLLTLAPYLPEAQKEKVQNDIEMVIDRVIAKAGAETLKSSLHEALNQQHTGLLSIGLAITLWAASGGVSMTMSALDSACDAPRNRPFYIQRPIAVMLTGVLSVMILLVFVLLPIGTAVTQWLSRQQYAPRQLIWALNFARYGLALVLLFGVLAILYKFGTSVKQEFVFLSPGAIFTVLVWIVLGLTFRFYVDKFGRYQKTYGAVGGVAIILFFFYLDALVLLVGAEINSEVDVAIKLKKGLLTAAPVHSEDTSPS